MNWKNIALIIGIYLVIFGSIFYLLLPTDQADDDVSMGQVINQVLKELKEKLTFKNFSNPFGFIKRMEISKHLLPTSCIIRRQIECSEFIPDKEKGILTFYFRNVMGRTVTIDNVKLTGDIECEKTVDKMVDPLQNFYVQLTNCTIKGVDSKLHINYYEGSSMFTRTIEGRVIVK